jgi:hypothetical protein
MVFVATLIHISINSYQLHNQHEEVGGSIAQIDVTSTKTSLVIVQKLGKSEREL